MRVCLFFFSLVFFFIVANNAQVKAGENIEFSAEASTYQARNWYRKNYPPLPKLKINFDDEDDINSLNHPKISKEDLLAFNTIQIKTENVRYYEEDDKEIREKYTEPSTGFLVYPENRANSINLIDNHYYDDFNEEVCLVTCRHCVQERPPEENIKSFSFIFHYVDPNQKKFYLLNIKLLNNNPDKKVSWELADIGDMAFLKLGKVLKKGKEYMDKTFMSQHYPFFRAIRIRDFCTDDDMESFHVGYLSKVVMFGYPYDLSGSNNMPLARFGYCATDPKQTATGAVDFYADMASIVGSSGSPVWFYSENFKTEVTSNISGIAHISAPHTGWGYDADVEIDDPDIETTKRRSYKFAGMLFGGPERSGEGIHDIHLSSIRHSKRIKEFLSEAIKRKYFKLKECSIDIPDDKESKVRLCVPYNFFVDDAIVYRKAIKSCPSLQENVQDLIKRYIACSLVKKFRKDLLRDKEFSIINAIAAVFNGAYKYDTRFRISLDLINRYNIIGYIEQNAEKDIYNTDSWLKMKSVIDEILSERTKAKKRVGSKNRFHDPLNTKIKKPVIREDFVFKKHKSCPSFKKT